MNAITPSAYHTLKVDNLAQVSSARLPLQPLGDINMDSPASELVTDFAVTAGRSIQGSASIGQALATMKQAGVRLLLVHDHDATFTGVVTSRELQGGRVVMRAMTRFDVQRDEVTVDMVQMPRAELHGIPLAELKRARVGDLVETLRQSGESHLLVTERDEDGQSSVRGLIAASRVGKALGIDLEHPPEARNFSDICRAVLGKYE
ncbi:CBS domain-containing protein [Cobetia sp. L2A1]|uniref:CBS domain-containing protein n=1 Tax=Cobetia sp. L2A1 TaxID=2686360 RepID=UPI00131BD070|nr:CBS domain-containing protein [Cobetia sp. L2A1]